VATRERFIARLRDRLAGGVPHNAVHPLPPPVDEVPPLAPTNLDRDDLPGTFTATATRVGMTVHRIATLDDIAPVLRGLVGERNVQTAVVSVEPEARRVGELLTDLGVAVSPLSIEVAAAADLGVTGAALGIAATGSLVQASAVSGGRTASLLPTAHLCIVRERDLVATTRDALRRVGDDDASSNTVFITGPSRSADIEQLLVTGVHGPTAVDIVLVAG
jgi:L-lactate dehydrogenase complex protein LldG